MTTTSSVVAKLAGPLGAREHAAPAGGSFLHWRLLHPRTCGLRRFRPLIVCLAVTSWPHFVPSTVPRERRSVRVAGLVQTLISAEGRAVHGVLLKYRLWATMEDPQIDRGSAIRCFRAALDAGRNGNRAHSRAACVIQLTIVCSCGWLLPPTPGQALSRSRPHPSLRMRHLPR